MPVLRRLYPLSVDFNLDATGSVGIGTTAPVGGRLHVVEDQAGNAVYAESGLGGATALTAISTNDSDGFGIKAESNAPVGRGVRAENKASTGNAIALEGVSRSTEGRGIFGIATQGTGESTGVWGETFSAWGGSAGVRGVAVGGAGVEGEASGQNGVGVRGLSSSFSGAAVRGINDATSGAAVGVEGITGSPTGRAVSGLASETSGANAGIFGETLSPAGSGVHGRTVVDGGTGVEGLSTSTVDGVGVRAEARSTAGRAVRAVNEATAGDAIGVEGITRSPLGRGVVGLATDASAAAATGVWGETAGAGSTAVRGRTTNASGPSVGVHGEVSSADGTGVIGSVGPPLASPGAGVVGRTNSVGTAGTMGFATDASSVGVFGGFDPAGIGPYLIDPSSGVTGTTLLPDANGVTGFSAWTGFGAGVLGYSPSEGGVGVRGRAGTSSGTGVHGSVGLDETFGGAGVVGSSSLAPAVVGLTDTSGTATWPGVLGSLSDAAATGFSYYANAGVSGATDEAGTAGVVGYHSATPTLAHDRSGVMGLIGAAPPDQLQRTAGVFGAADTLGIGVLGRVRNGVAVYGASLANTVPTLLTDAGVLGQSDLGAGVAGHSATGIGVRGVTTSGYVGVYGESSSTENGDIGVYGLLTGESGSASAGVYGYNASSSNLGAAVRGDHGGSGAGVLGISGNFGTGVRGYAGDSGAGVIGETTGPTGFGVYSFGDFGGTGAKYFVHPHAEDPSKEIRYVALEGSEAGTYFRGTARLSGGVAEIAVPEHFRLVSEPEGLTVHLTVVGAPASVWTVERSLDAIVVAGTADVELDYVVHGVRRGFAGLDPVHDNWAYVPRERGVPFGPHLRPAVRDTLVANGTLNADYTPNEATAEREGWTLRDPTPDTADLLLPEAPERLSPSAEPTTRPAPVRFDRAPSRARQQDPSELRLRR